MLIAFVFGRIISLDRERKRQRLNAQIPQPGIDPR
jgi:hypothetical protein